MDMDKFTKVFADAVTDEVLSGLIHTRKVKGKTVYELSDWMADNVHDMLYDVRDDKELKKVVTAIKKECLAELLDGDQKVLRAAIKKQVTDRVLG